MKISISPKEVYDFLENPPLTAEQVLFAQYLDTIGKESYRSYSSYEHRTSFVRDTFPIPLPSPFIAGISRTARLNNLFEASIVLYHSSFNEKEYLRFSSALKRKFGNQWISCDNHCSGYYCLSENRNALSIYSVPGQAALSLSVGNQGTLPIPFKNTGQVHSALGNLEKVTNILIDIIFKNHDKSLGSVKRPKNLVIPF